MPAHNSLDGAMLYDAGITERYPTRLSCNIIMFLSHHVKALLVHKYGILFSISLSKQHSSIKQPKMVKTLL